MQGQPQLGPSAAASPGLSQAASKIPRAEPALGPRDPASLPALRDQTPVRAQGHSGPDTDVAWRDHSVASAAGSGDMVPGGHQTGGQGRLPPCTPSPLLISSFFFFPKNLISFHFNPKQMTRLLLSLSITPCPGGCSEGPTGPRGEQGSGCTWARPTSVEQAAHGRKGMTSRRGAGWCPPPVPPPAPTGLLRHLLPPLLLLLGKD